MKKLIVYALSLIGLFSWIYAIGLILTTLPMNPFTFALYAVTFVCPFIGLGIFYPLED